MLYKNKKPKKKLYNIAFNFFNALYREINSSYDLYPREIANTFNSYYSNIKKNENFDYYRYCYSIRTMHLLKNIREGDKILDAGCGVGSEAILCSLLGGNVDGFDISETRLNTAEKRIDYYEKKYNKKLKISFAQKNILKHSGDYKVIWVNEAISHIAPIDEFFKVSYDNLEKGGKLIIADTNNINPIMYVKNRYAQKRSGGVYLEREDPITKETYVYAVERCFSIPSIKKLLSGMFEIDYIFPFGYFPPLIFNLMHKTCEILDYVIKEIPFLKFLSGGYVVVSTKK